MECLILADSSSCIDLGSRPFWWTLLGAGVERSRTDHGRVMSHFDTTGLQKPDPGFRYDKDACRRPLVRSYIDPTGWHLI
jgi:hypothetical protein